MATLPANSSPAQSSIDEGVDRKALKIIRKRFLDINHARLERTKSALNARQQQFLELLPLLFHVTHPMLPGYISHDTPSGVIDYTPTRSDISRAQKLARSFTLQRDPTLAREIHALFLMGSCGTIAHSEKSDLDIWVCHSDSLNGERQSLLRARCDNISRWAAELGLEVHFFLMSAQRFRAGERENLSTEDCGSSQHYLLLDEFYRTGLIIAGQIPIWWLVPPEEEAHYNYFAETLRRKRFIKAGETLDFGSVGKIPAGEFIGAGIWQLYKAIDSPYKSVLKLLINEIYASEYPQVESLSTMFKKAIYADRLDIDELDPYVMIYRRLEKYLLGRGETERLELVRRCFYFKIGKALSKPPAQRSKSWQRKLMERLAAEWGWHAEHIVNLDLRNRWKVLRVIEEQKSLVRELTNSYRFLVEFARKTQATALIDSRDMTVLGRKLYAAFERRAGKVEWINPGISQALGEDFLNFALQTNHDGEAIWGVYAEAFGNRELLRQQALKRNRELMALLAWCHCNGLLSENTRIGLLADKTEPGKYQLSENELQQILRTLRQLFPVTGSDHSTQNSDDVQARFSQPAQPQLLLLVINVGIDPLSNIRAKGIERLSSRTDSLGFSGLRENLILNIEQLLLNSWGEVTTRSYNGNQSILDCLRDYLLLLPPGTPQAIPRLEVRCFSPTRANAITQRVEELFRDLISSYYSGTRPLTTRYVLEFQHGFQILQFDNDVPAFHSVASYSELMAHLGQPQTVYSPIVLDRHCLPRSTLAAVCNNQIADCTQIFFRQLDDQAEIFILDELGSLYRFQTTFRDIATLLHPLEQFMCSLAFRRNGEIPLAHSSKPANLNLEYYEIRGNDVYLIAPQWIDNIEHRFFPVQAIGEPGENNGISFTIYCDQQEFSSWDYGDGVFDAVAEFILSRRRSRERYPCYITDLDLSRCHNNSSQSIHHLHYKQWLESRLNDALSRL